MHWAALCPAGVVRHDDEGGAEVQAGVLRGAGGLDDQSGQHTGQACQHKIHIKRVNYFETQRGCGLFVIIPYSRKQFGLNMNMLRMAACALLCFTVLSFWPPLTT